MPHDTPFPSPILSPLCSPTNVWRMAALNSGESLESNWGAPYYAPDTEDLTTVGGAAFRVDWHMTAKDLPAGADLFAYYSALDLAPADGVAAWRVLSPFLAGGTCGAALERGATIRAGDQVEWDDHGAVFAVIASDPTCRAEVELASSTAFGEDPTYRLVDRETGNASLATAWGDPAEVACTEGVERWASEVLIEGSPQAFVLV